MIKTKGKTVITAELLQIKRYFTSLFKKCDGCVITPNARRAQVAGSYRVHITKEYFRLVESTSAMNRRDWVIQFDTGKLYLNGDEKRPEFFSEISKRIDAVVADIGNKNVTIYQETIVSPNNQSTRKTLPTNNPVSRSYVASIQKTRVAGVHEGTRIQPPPSVLSSRKPKTGKLLSSNRKTGVRQVGSLSGANNLSSKDVQKGLGGLAKATQQPIIGTHENRVVASISYVADLEEKAGAIERTEAEKADAYISNYCKNHNSTKPIAIRTYCQDTDPKTNQSFIRLGLAKKKGKSTNKRSGGSVRYLRLVSIKEIRGFNDIKSDVLKLAILNASRSIVLKEGESLDETQRLVRAHNEFLIGLMVAVKQPDADYEIESNVDSDTGIEIGGQKEAPQKSSKRDMKEVCRASFSVDTDYKTMKNDRTKVASSKQSRFKPEYDQDMKISMVIDTKDQMFLPGYLGKKLVYCHIPKPPEATIKGHLKKKDLKAFIKARKDVQSILPKDVIKSSGLSKRLPWKVYISRLISPWPFGMLFIRHTRLAKEIRRSRAKFVTNYQQLYTEMLNATLPENGAGLEPSPEEAQKLFNFNKGVIHQLDKRLKDLSDYIEVEFSELNSEVKRVNKAMDGVISDAAEKLEKSLGKLKPLFLGASNYDPLHVFQIIRDAREEATKSLDQVPKIMQESRENVSFRLSFGGKSQHKTQLEKERAQVTEITQLYETIIGTLDEMERRTLVPVLRSMVRTHVRTNIPTEVQLNTVVEEIQTLEARLAPSPEDADIKTDDGSDISVTSEELQVVISSIDTLRTMYQALSDNEFPNKDKILNPLLQYRELLAKKKELLTSAKSTIETHDYERMRANLDLQEAFLKVLKKDVNSKIIELNNNAEVEYSNGIQSKVTEWFRKEFEFLNKKDLSYKEFRNQKDEFRSIQRLCAFQAAEIASNYIVSDSGMLPRYQTAFDLVKAFNEQMDGILSMHTELASRFSKESQEYSESLLAFRKPSIPDSLKDSVSDDESIPSDGCLEESNSSFSSQSSIELGESASFTKAGNGSPVSDFGGYDKDGFYENFFELLSGMMSAKANFQRPKKSRLLSNGNTYHISKLPKALASAVLSERTPDLNLLEQLLVDRHGNKRKGNKNLLKACLTQSSFEFIKEFPQLVGALRESKRKDTLSQIERQLGLGEQAGKRVLDWFSDTAGDIRLIIRNASLDKTFRILTLPHPSALGIYREVDYKKAFDSNLGDDGVKMRIKTNADYCNAYSNIALNLQVDAVSQVNELLGTQDSADVKLINCRRSHDGRIILEIQTTYEKPVMKIINHRNSYGKIVEQEEKQINVVKKERNEISLCSPEQCGIDRGASNNDFKEFGWKTGYDALDRCVKTNQDYSMFYDAVDVLLGVKPNIGLCEDIGVPQNFVPKDVEMESDVKNMDPEGCDNAAIKPVEKEDIPKTPLDLLREELELDEKVLADRSEVMAGLKINDKKLAGYDSNELRLWIKQVYNRVIGQMDDVKAFVDQSLENEPGRKEELNVVLEGYYQDNVIANVAFIITETLLDPKRTFVKRDLRFIFPGNTQDSVSIYADLNTWMRYVVLESFGLRNPNLLDVLNEGCDTQRLEIYITEVLRIYQDSKEVCVNELRAIKDSLKEIEAAQSTINRIDINNPELDVQKVKDLCRVDMKSQNMSKAVIDALNFDNPIEELENIRAAKVDSTKDVIFSKPFLGLILNRINTSITPEVETVLQVFSELHKREVISGNDIGATQVTKIKDAVKTLIDRTKKDNIGVCANGLTGSIKETKPESLDTAKIYLENCLKLAGAVLANTHIGPEFIPPHIKAFINTYGA